MMRVVNMTRAPGYVKTDKDTYQVQPRSVVRLKGSKVVSTNIPKLQVLETTPDPQRPRPAATSQN